MISISPASSVILVSAAIHLTILLSETKSSNTLPPNYIPHLPFSLGNFANNSLAYSNLQNTEPTAALSETISGINYWSKLLTTRNPGNLTIEKTTAYPLRGTTLRFRSRTHRRKHLPKHLRRSEMPSLHVMPKWVTKKVTVITESPEIKTTKLPRSKNPLCYFLRPFLATLNIADNQYEAGLD